VPVNTPPAPGTCRGRTGSEIIEGAGRSGDPAAGRPPGSTWRRRRIAHTIPERHGQLAVRARRGGRRCGFDREIYRGRNVVERCFNQLERFRGIATRHDELAAHHRSAVTIISPRPTPGDRPVARVPATLKGA
jgi:transposase